MKKIYFLILFFSSISNVNSQCNHTIRLTDTFGDGWNGGTVSVSVNGVNVLTNITLGSGFGPMNVTFSAVTGNTIRVYETAAGSFANEMRVQVFDGGMTSIIAQIDPVTGTATTGGTTGIANCPPAMTFSSSTVTQSSIASVVNCSSNAQIIRLEITTAGVTAPLTLTQIQSNFAGTALPANISLAKVFYTGTSATFSTTTLFGSATPTVANYNINGSQVLATGVNHFWLVYDLNNTGVIGNTVDAIIPQFTLAATNRIPTVTSPAGTRAITICLGPGGVTSGLETWLKADLAYASGSPATWANQGQGAATLINGTANPARNTTSTSYNYNPYIEFTGPSGALFNGGADPVRQFVRLAGNDDLVGPNFRSLFFTSNLTDLSRVYTHLGTVNSISGSSPLNGTISGDDNGGNAAVNQAVYDPLDFGNIAGVWQRNATNISSNAVHLTTKNMLSAVTATGNGTIVNRFLGGQNDNSSGSFEGGVRDWRGPVGEVIGFTSQLTAAERRRVHTYLAVKYGITLAGNYLNTAGTNIYTPTAPYNLNIIGIGRDDVEALFQKQSHQDDDTVRIYLNTIAGTNIANGGSFGNDLSYVVQGSDNRRLCTTASAMTEIPAS